MKVEGKYVFGPKYLEIEVISTNKPVPENEMGAFKEWLDIQSTQSTNGRNYEYFSYNSDFADDIGVEFYVFELNVVPDIDLFVEFLKENGWEIKFPNPKHVPGQGYSPPPYYSDCNIDTALRNFRKEKKQ